MRFASVRHKGLKRYIERGDVSGLPLVYASKLAAMITLLGAMRRIDEVMAVEKWHIHPLTGDRKGDWSFAVSRNWRLTFRLGEADGVIYDLDFEDYH